MNWQPYFDGRTLDLGYKLHKAGRPSMLYGGLPYHILANIKKTAAGLQECKVDIKINDDTEFIEEASCTCESFKRLHIPCRHIAATMFAWEDMKNSKQWYDYFHGYRTCSDQDIIGIKYDIDQDFFEYENEVKSRLIRGMDKEIIDLYFLNELYFSYRWPDYFKNIMKQGNALQMFEIYKHVAEKASEFKYFDEKQRRMFYKMCADNWKTALFYGSEVEKMGINLHVERFLSLDKKNYCYICAKMFKKAVKKHFETPQYNLHLRISNFLKNIPQGYVVTYKSLVEHLGVKDLTVRELTQAIEYPVLKPDIKAYKIVKSNGEMSKFLSGVDNDLQREKLEAEGVEFINKRVDMEACLY